ncbi:calcium-dependent protein kinase 19 [Iris pallida]|uniref:non-specific serine/threonine protein kinase n=1 Tax=Iris pallida TaxID=29817 RepID=A0AAX6HIW5_IRIPA|nr:calcium-dependent protein kinase 19 [Iris pallida]KAJ6840454.1 calcium-dependent protein kinase 19 [Iris pallida]
MAVVANGNSNNISRNHYKVPGLVNPILDTTNISYLEDRYVLGDQLGWGQFGVIRVCTDMVTAESLACKSIAKDRLVSPDDIRSVKLEIEVMARLSGHPNVVDLKAVYEEESCVHLVMELCAGGELFHRIEKHGRFSETDAALLFRPLMEVVMYCHDNGIVHRDLKPENILLANKSSSSPIKLADFGLATYIKPGKSLYGTVGSPFYIAPEVLAGGYNEAADVWSAGVILYILLSGMPPFWGNTKSRIFESVRSADLQFLSDPWDGVSESARELVTRMLCRDPAHRLTAKQVLEHSWIKRSSCSSQTPYAHGSIVKFGRELNSGASSLSTMQISTTRDFSFGFGFTSPVSCHNQPDASSPTFTCRSSFSTFDNDASPFRSTTGFSLENSYESSSMGFSSPIPSMPSFSFFSLPPSDVQENPLAFGNDSSNSNIIRRDPSIGKQLVSPDNGHDIWENRGSEFRRGTVASTSRENIHLRSKRNHTIGLGEQLDLMVSESVVRWASCIHFSCAPSLRSSLVC